MRAATAGRGHSTGNRIRVDGRELFVRQIGDGYPLLLINGLGLPLETWADLEPHLPNSRLIEVDLPGSGRSPATRPPVRMPSFARLACRLLDELGIPTADVLGLSFGGMVAQQLAVERPHRVRRMVLASTSCGWGGVPPNPFTWYPSLFTGQTAATSADPADLLDRATCATRAADRPSSTYSRLRRGFSAPGARLPQPRAYARQVVAATTWTSLPWLARLEQPTLVIGGAADSLIPAANACLLSTCIPNARSHVVESGGHLCLLDRAAEVGPVIERFLADGR